MKVEFMILLLIYDFITRYVWHTDSSCQLIGNIQAGGEGKRMTEYEMTG